MAPKYAEVWDSLRDEEYRREFSDDVGTGLAFQIRSLREKNGWTQEQLAERTGKKQETISLWENPNYGSYTLNSLKGLAAAFDVSLLVKFAPFSDLVDWSVNLTPERLAPPSFIEEDAARQIGWSWQPAPERYGSVVSANEDWITFFTTPDNNTVTMTLPSMSIPSMTIPSEGASQSMEVKPPTQPTAKERQLGLAA